MARRAAGRLVGPRTTGVKDTRLRPKSKRDPIGLGHVWTAQITEQDVPKVLSIGYSSWTSIAAIAGSDAKTLEHHVTPFLIIVTIAFIAWRYRRVLGLDQRWDQHGRAHADDLAQRLGWSTRKATVRRATGSHKVPVTTRPAERSFYPRLDTSRLPASLAVGALVGIVVVALDIQGMSLLSFAIGILVGPFAGGVYVRSRWWLLVAPAVAIVVGAGGEIGPLIVAFPVAAIAYAGLRTDVAAWIARLNAEPD